MSCRSHARSTWSPYASLKWSHHRDDSNDTKEGWHQSSNEATHASITQQPSSHIGECGTMPYIFHPSFNLVLYSLVILQLYSEFHHN
jgi:hypothetical protein